MQDWQGAVSTELACSCSCATAADPWNCDSALAPDIEVLREGVGGLSSCLCICSKCLVSAHALKHRCCLDASSGEMLPEQRAG